jgi:membrane fusion protein, heavy metal efflux system
MTNPFFNLITLKEKNKMFKSYRISNLLFLAVFAAGLTLFFACKAGGEKAEPATSSEETHEEESNELELSQVQMKAVGIILGKVEQKNLHSVVRASGQLEVPPQNKADVATLVGGVIRTITVLEGANVKKGQTLALLENPDFLKLQQEYVTSKNAFTYTEQEYQRQQELSTGNAGTGKVFQQAEANYRVEKARIASLEEQLRQLNISPTGVMDGKFITRIPLKAPIGGTVSHITAKIGTYAEPSNSLMEIVDNSQIHCDLLVYEKDLFKVKVGQKVNFILTNQNNQQITGTIYGVNQSFENESKAVVVHARITNGHKLRLIPGMYVSALIDVGDQSVGALPVEAVVQAEGKNYIFIVTDEDDNPAEKNEKKSETGEATDQALHFKKIEVVTGVTELGYVEITPVGELPEDARVVTKGAFYLLSKISGGGEEE